MLINSNHSATFVANPIKSPRAGIPAKNSHSDIKDTFNRSLRFQSLATAVASNTYYQNHRKKLEEQKQQDQLLALQQFICPPPQISMPPFIVPQPIKFGGDAFTIGWFGTTLGSSAIDKIFSYITSSLSKNADDHNSKLALTYLENAQNSTTENGQIHYLEKAESKLLRATHATENDLELAQIYKHLAIVSKMLGRDARVTDKYASQAMSHFDDHAEYIIGLGNSAARTVGASVPTSTVARYEYDELSGPYLRSDVPRVCNELHSSKSYAKKLIEPEECVIM